MPSKTLKRKPSVSRFAGWLCKILFTVLAINQIGVLLNLCLVTGSDAKINNHQPRPGAHIQKPKPWSADDDTAGVTLQELRVPPYVMAGAKNGVVLDCLYSLRPKSIGLVVAWYFNNSARPVYQWIPGEKPLSIGIFRHRTNLDYKVSDNNETMHRALHIINPTIELSGDYRCVVSTYHDEDFMIKRMIVYSPEKKFEVFQHQVNNDTIRVTCLVTRVFPMPRLTLFNNSITDKQSFEMINVMNDMNRSKDGYYNVSVSVLISEEELNMQSSLDCELKIPDTPYVKRKTYVFFPDPNAADQTYPPMMIFSAITIYWIFNIIFN
ncbi:uncharacterized protein LOC126839680 [Adelges cooleyi]|uniref:uncharacterized protein LOC126839680 n=1 Tax=Adelges cooleyi TaxID=133065 RepID=UPI00217F9C26|nr:uncharacterized protein LOC126839680 [Adelges cooleyi]